MNEMHNEVWELLCMLSGEDVARIFIDYYGWQIINDEFREYLGTEGYMEEVEDESD